MATKGKVEPRFDLAYFLICDDVRVEIGAKLTYLGVYGDSIIIESESGVIKLAFVFSFRADDADPTEATFRVDGPDGLAFPELTLPFQPPLSPLENRRHAVIQIGGMKIKVGTYRARLTVEGCELEGSFNVKSDPKLLNALLNPGYPSDRAVKPLRKRRAM